MDRSLFYCENSLKSDPLFASFSSNAMNDIFNLRHILMFRGSSSLMFDSYFFTQQKPSCGEFVQHEET